MKRASTQLNTLPTIFTQHCFEMRYLGIDLFLILQVGVYLAECVLPALLKIHDFALILINVDKKKAQGKVMDA